MTSKELLEKIEREKYGQYPYGNLEPASNSVGDICSTSPHLLLVVDVQDELVNVMPLIESDMSTNRDVILPENMLKPFSQHAVAANMMFTMIGEDLGAPIGKLPKKYFMQCVNSAFKKPEDNVIVGPPILNGDDPRIQFKDDLCDWLNSLVNKAIKRVESQKNK